MGKRDMAELTQMRIVSIGDLERNLGVRRWPRYIRACEMVFQDRLRRIALDIQNRQNVRAVFISGPTASGKTTFTHRLAARLQALGHTVHIISLDDYYLTTTITYDQDGRPDYESIHTLDTRQIVSDFADLLAGKMVQLPTFDFIGRRRLYAPEKQIQLSRDDLILIEGLHGLSSEIAGHFAHEQYYGIFIMPWCTLLDGRQLLGSRDLRMLRRISRDVQHRGSTALSTIDYWPMIDRTEQRFFPRYLAAADAYINSALPYEFSVIAPLASRFLRASLESWQNGTLAGSVYRKDRDGYADLASSVEAARDLLAACARIPETDRSLIPEDSILNEFVH